MTNAEYHASGAVSKSILDMIHKSPAYYKHCMENPREQTEAMLLGSVVHKLVLEPAEFTGEYAIAPECDRRTKDGKAAYNAFIEALGAGLTAVPAATYETAKAMAEAVRAHPIASMLLQDGNAEQSFFWERDGIKCSCRPDWLRDDGLVVDLKTTKNSSSDEFKRSAYNFRYYVQAWWYLDGLLRCGITAEKFIFIAVESAPPYHVCVYAADDMFVKLGKIEAMEDFETYRRCTESGEWYGYEKHPAVHDLSLPEYVAKRFSQEYTENPVKEEILWESQF